MSSLGTLEIHAHVTKREYLGRWHPDYTKEGDLYDLLTEEMGEEGFCGFPGKREVEALGLPSGSPNPLTWGEVVCHLIPTEHSKPTSLPVGTRIYVSKAVAGNPNLCKPICSMDLTRRAEAALTSSGKVRTVQDVLLLGGHRVHKLRGAGYKTVLEVRSALLALGLKLDSSWKLPNRLNNSWKSNS